MLNFVAGLSYFCYLNINRNIRVMNRIFIDTSAWYAFIDKNDPDHKGEEKLYKSNTKPLITSNFIFDETVTLLMSRLGFDIAVKFGESLKKSIS